jgi:hypothetical protein
MSWWRYDNERRYARKARTPNREITLGFLFGVALGRHGLHCDVSPLSKSNIVCPGCNLYRARHEFAAEAECENCIARRK